MKLPHNMKPGDRKIFKTLGEIHDFAETYEHKVEEFKFNCDSKGQLEMIKKHAPDEKVCDTINSSF